MVVLAGKLEIWGLSFRNGPTVESCIDGFYLSARCSCKWLFYFAAPAYCDFFFIAA